MYKLWISDGFDLFFVVNIFCIQICCPRSIQAAHACHSEVSMRLFCLWSPRRFVVAPFDVGTMFPCSKKCDLVSLRIERRFIRHVCQSMPFVKSKPPLSTGNLIRESVRMKYWVGSHNPARTLSGSMYKLWISDGFDLFFVVNIFCIQICCPRSIQAAHACHSEVSMRLFWFVVSKAICCCTFRCRHNVSMFEKCDSVPLRIERRFIRHICQSMPFVKSKPPLSTRSLRSLRAAARFTSSLRLRLHHAFKR